MQQSEIRRGQGETADPSLFGGVGREVFMRLPIPVFIHDGAGRCLAVNARFTELTGFDAAEISDSPVWRALVGGVSDAESSVAPNVGGGGSSAPRREIVVDSHDGARMIWQVEETARNVAASGETIFISSAVDVTAQRAAEAEAARRRCEADALYAASPLGLALFDRDLKVVRINEALAQFNGVAVEDHIGRFIFDLVPDLRGPAEPFLRRALETGEAVNNIEVSGETARAPGVRRTWLTHVHAVRDDSGEISGVGAICEEVTEKRAADLQMARLTDELARTLHLFRVALRAADITAFAMDRERRFIWASEGGWERPASELIGLRDEDVFPQDRWSVAVPHKDEVLREGGQRTFDVPAEFGGRRRVFQVRIEAMRDENDAIFGLVGASIDITESKAHQTHVEALLRELSHRSKNLLAVIQGLARHSARRAKSLPQFIDAFLDRLESLSRSQDLLTSADWRGVALFDLAQAQLALGGARDASGLSIDGPSIELNPRGVQNLGMALHELTTNAVRFGALSVPGGRVDLTWRIDREGAGAGDGKAHFVMTWVESGGPSVAGPEHAGFGLFMTRDLVARALLGKVTLEFAPTGLRWTLIAPKSSLVDDGAPEPPQRAT